ncbi:MAG: hypothetical protein ACPL1D_01740 [Microgenomates group bacterium]
MNKEIAHSLILIFAIGLTFIFPQTRLAQYDLQFSAILFIIFFLAKRIIPENPKSKLLESVIFTLVILGIVNTTGSVNSPFFFLIYFLLFSLSLLLEPVISIVTSLTLIIFYLLSLPSNQNLKTLLPIFSLAFISPFALFLGQQYLENQKEKLKNQKNLENTFLFLSLVLKNQIKNIKEAAENFLGDHQLHQIKRSTSKMEKLIEKFEKSLK